MKIHRVLFLFTAIWEFLRFLTLFLAVWVTFRQVIQNNNQAIYWLLIFGNGGLLITAALVFLYVDPRLSRTLLNLVRLGKILGLFSALLLIVLEPVGMGLRSLSLAFFPYSVAPLSILLILCCIDLVLLFLLFSYQNATASQADPPLPPYGETIIPPKR